MKHETLIAKLISETVYTQTVDEHSTNSLFVAEKRLVANTISSVWSTWIPMHTLNMIK